ncbi:hypothetical protein BJ322DRAFT_153418 [Thelephora terrestris]|uniref:Zn(2)-C6 fungal-type domain-containing protein n=1 Tax=Thelephora terrestris TaxID=56493 RepID=A0A9P6HBC2_9AGAM|nr:hypothetical protein BJ322DRAFT_153418 [Thelephora terrestris]
MSQSRAIACLRCRARKVKCVPNVPRCRRCIELGVEECVYVQRKKRAVRDLLRIGEACLPCRKRKKKCNAERPCSGCVDAHKPEECVYDRPRKFHPQPRRILPATTNSLPLVYRSGSGSFQVDSSASLPESLFTTKEGLMGLTGNQPSTSFAPAGPAGSASSGFDPSPLSFEEPVLAIAPYFGDALPSGVLPVVNCSDLVLWQGQPSYEDQCALSVVSSALFPRIPPAPHVPLSFLGEPNIQISHTTPELEMTFRLAGLVRMRRMGTYLSPRKQEALLNGDMSGVILHPYFLHKVITFGMHHSSIVKESSPPMVLLHARYIQSFWEKLADISQGNDCDLKVQALLFLVAGCLFVRQSRVGALYLWKACGVVNAGEMRFVPRYGHPPPYSDEVHERSTVLSQLIWMENYLFLACDGARPKLTKRIEEEFRNELPGIYSVLFQVCPLTMRTQGILLVRDVVLFLEELQNPEAMPGDWKQSCDLLASSLDDYSDMLMIRLGECENVGDKEGASIIRSSCISCLAHLAVLYHSIGEMQPRARTTVDGLCDAVLDNLGNLSQGMELEDVTVFDLVLKVSWEKALKIYDSRLNELSVEEGSELWRWRCVVAEAYADMERRLPKREPPILTSLALLEDGRSEGSRYPNLMNPANRKDYGM